MKNRLLIVVNSDWFFLSHRLPIALEALKQGFEVHLATLDYGNRKTIEEYGIQFHDLPISRSGTNPISEIRSLIGIIRLFKRINPSVVHNITLKAVTYGSVACRLLKIPQVNAISGLGYLFTGRKQGFAAKGMLNLMKYGFGDINNSHFIFQNEDDLKEVRDKGLLQKSNVTIIKGSGVDLEKFNFTPLPKELPLQILLPARMLFDKGIKEFKESSELLFEKWKGKIKFILAGKLDSGNPTAISEKELLSWNVTNYFEWIGHQKDIKAVYKNSFMVVLPSYREGFPKSLIEACAIGRPIVTTNAVGCKDAVVENYNGFKVSVQNSEELAAKIDEIVSKKELALKFSENSRTFAEKEFSIHQVVSTHISIYKSLI
jgi:glycosyltransferase involved in cell wall biosynthesis